MMQMQTLVEVATAIGATVTAASAVYGTFRVFPWLRSQSDLIRENTQLRMERNEARDAASAFRQSSDGWQAAVEQLGSEMKDIRAELGSLKNNLGAAIMYIVECNEADRHDRPLPLPPTILQPLIQKAYLDYHPERRSASSP